LVASFEFATATRIVFGPGTAGQATAAARAWGRRPLLVTGASVERASVLGLDGQRLSITGEPTISAIREAVAAARAAGCDVVVALGGGSVIDAGKAIAALVPNPEDVLAYLEVIGAGQPLSHPPLPFIAVPTTAGTGAEVTRNAVLGAPEQGVKVSLRSPLMLPSLAVIDPELALTVPPAVTAATGLDALTQLIEPWVSPRANPLTGALCLDGIRRVATALPRAFHHPGDLSARTDMALAALYGGLALANAGLGAVHGFASPMGGQFDAPHGAVCAALLPHVIRANVAALRSRDSGSESLRRYGVLTDILGEDPAEFSLRLLLELGIPPLREYGITPAHIPGLCRKAMEASSMKANPIRLTQEELEAILTAALGEGRQPT
jgi:alcohol dehydrogenase class IV